MPGRAGIKRRGKAGETRRLTTSDRARRAGAPKGVPGETIFGARDGDLVAGGVQGASTIIASCCLAPLVYKSINVGGDNLASLRDASFCSHDEEQTFI